MVSLLPLATPVQMRNAEMVDELCRASMGCGGLDPAVHLALLAVTGVLTLVFMMTVVHLFDARAALTEERSRVVAEREAFAAFAREVGELSPQSVNPVESATGPDVAGAVAAVGAGPADRDLERVKDVYRNTVMAVSHYEEDYGESLVTNMATEFGEEVATAVTEGTQLSPPLQQALVRKGVEAQRERSGFLDTLDREEEELAAAEETLTAVDETLAAVDERPIEQRSFAELFDVWHQLSTLRERCACLLKRRQCQIQEKKAARSADDTPVTLNDYLYDSLPVSHPVLADATTLVDRLETAEGRVLSAITRRV